MGNSPTRSQTQTPAGRDQFEEAFETTSNNTDSDESLRSRKMDINAPSKLGHPSSSAAARLTTTVDSSKSHFQHHNSSVPSRRPYKSQAVRVSSQGQSTGDENSEERTPGTSEDDEGYSDHGRIDQDIDMLFSYLDGWPDELDDYGDLPETRHLSTKCSQVPGMSTLDETEEDEATVSSRETDCNVPSPSQPSESSNISAKIPPALPEKKLSSKFNQHPTSLLDTKIESYETRHVKENAAKMKELPIKPVKSLNLPGFAGKADYGGKSVKIDPIATYQSEDVPVKNATASHKLVKRSQSTRSVNSASQGRNIPDVCIYSSTNGLQEEKRDRNLRTANHAVPGSRKPDICLVNSKEQMSRRSLISPDTDTDSSCYQEIMRDRPRKPPRNKLQEGDIVTSLYSCSSTMPGTISFSRGQSGVVMRLNVGGWCYVSLRDCEGWAPVNYWKVIRKHSVDDRWTGTQEDWLWASLNRPDCSFLLLCFGQDGDFLVRNSSTRDSELTLSVRHKDNVHHFALRQVEQDRFTIGSLNFQFNCLEDIISHYQEHTILSDSYAILQEPFSLRSC